MAIFCTMTYLFYIILLYITYIDNGNQ